MKPKWKKILFYFGLLPLALILFYIFSIGPACALLVRFPNLQNRPYYQIVETFYQPLEVLMADSDSLGDALDAYCEFWVGFAMTEEERKAWDSLSTTVTNTNTNAVSVSPSTE